jgi:hypothetical protein
MPRYFEKTDLVNLYNFLKFSRINVVPPATRTAIFCRKVLQLKEMILTSANITQVLENSFFE